MNLKNASFEIVLGENAVILGECFQPTEFCSKTPTAGWKA